MQCTSSQTRVPPAQPIMTISICQNLPLSQTKPVRATEWKTPRFNPVAPSVRVQSAGQHHVSSAVSPAFHVWSVRSPGFLLSNSVVSLCCVWQELRRKNPGRDLGGGRPWLSQGDTQHVLPPGLLQSIPSANTRTAGFETCSGGSCSKWCVRLLRRPGGSSCGWCVLFQNT